MSYVKCVCCNCPLSIHGKEQITTCSTCGAKQNVGMIKSLFALSAKADKKRRIEYNLFKPNNQDFKHEEFNYYCPT